MAIRTKVCYVAYCDGCGKTDEEDYIPHYDTEGEALEGLSDGDWFIWQGHIWCCSCVPYCRCGHLFGDHDYGGAACEDCSCEEYNPIVEGA